MAIKAANPLAPFWHTPLGADEAEPTRFQLRGLTPFELADVNTGAEVVGGQIKWSGRALRAALRAGLLGWEHFADADGKPVEFSRNPDVNAERLGYLLTTELFVAIVNASNLSEDQRKN